MKKLVTNPALFTSLYIVFMIPTYILPYMGSNSSVLNIAALGMNPFFWLHLLILLALVTLTWYRGNYIAKSWLVIFPVLALVFDLIPGLSSIPLVPTVMHLLAIILAVVGVNAVEN